MNFATFKSITESHWNCYFDFVKRQETISDGVSLFPSHIIVMNNGTHFSYELIGAKRTPNKLQVVTRKCSSLNLYFNLFPKNIDDNEPIFNLGKSNVIQDLMLCHQIIFEKAKHRFPFIETFQSIIQRTDGEGALITVGHLADECCIVNCLLTSSLNEIIRCKHIIHLGFIIKSKTGPDYQKFLNHICSDQNICGITTVGKNKESMSIMMQLQSLFLSDGIHETTTGSFINKHSQVIERAFKTKKLIYEPYLNWIEHDGSVNKNENAINPDLLIMREDGYFDIVDLKLAGLRFKKLTKGERRRRRFIDYVQEGLAQLANYEFYFKFDGNRDHAENKYGLHVKDPQLILVVGNLENFDYDEVAEALRTNDSKRFTIIDYDTLSRSVLD